MITNRRPPQRNLSAQNLRPAPQLVTITDQHGRQIQGQLQYDVKTLVTEAPRIVVHAYFLIDASGSMSFSAGGSVSRMNVVLGHVQRMASMFCPTDRITLSFFNGKGLRQVGMRTIKS